TFSSTPMKKGVCQAEHSEESVSPCQCMRSFAPFRSGRFLLRSLPAIQLFQEVAKSRSIHVKNGRIWLRIWVRSRSTSFVFNNVVASFLIFSHFSGPSTPLSFP